MILYLLLGALLSLFVLLAFIMFQRRNREADNEKEFERNPDTIFITLNHPAEPVGGLKGMYHFFAKNMRYPLEAKNLEIEGRVYIQFIVEKDGSLSAITALKGIGGGCDEEAIRVIESYGNWIPAQIKGQAARQRMVIPIVFKL